MSYSELFRNFLRRSANDFVRELPEEVLAAWCNDLSMAQNRFTSIQASHPIEIGSAWNKREGWCSLESSKRKAISSFINFSSPYNAASFAAYSSLVGLQFSQRL